MTGLSRLFSGRGATVQSSHDETAYTCFPDGEPPGILHAERPADEGEARAHGRGRSREDFVDPTVRPERVSGHVSPHDRQEGEQDRTRGPVRRGWRSPAQHG